MATSQTMYSKDFFHIGFVKDSDGDYICLHQSGKQQFRRETLSTADLTNSMNLKKLLHLYEDYPGMDQ